MKRKESLVWGLRNLDRWFCGLIFKKKKPIAEYEKALEASLKKQKEPMLACKGVFYLQKKITDTLQGKQRDLSDLTDKMNCPVDNEDAKSTLGRLDQVKDLEAEIVHLKGEQKKIFQNTKVAQNVILQFREQVQELIDQKPKLITKDLASEKACRIEESLSQLNVDTLEAILNGSTEQPKSESLDSRFDNIHVNPPVRNDVLRNSPRNIREQKKP